METLVWLIEAPATTAILLNRPRHPNLIRHLASFRASSLPVAELLRLKPYGLCEL